MLSDQRTSRPEQTVASAETGNLFITAGDSVAINGSVGGTVQTANIVASNGIIHIIDKVLLPDEFGTIVQNAQKRYDLETLVSALGTADLVTTLSGTGPFTVFAPTDDAFSAITVPIDATALANVLTHHVLSDKVLLVRM